jgi:hypothetical protein
MILSCSLQLRVFMTLSLTTVELFVVAKLLSLSSINAALRFFVARFISTDINVIVLECDWRWAMGKLELFDVRGKYDCWCGELERDGWDGWDENGGEERRGGKLITARGVRED